jgi:DNA-binding XRE family transcriptional regulator
MALSTIADRHARGKLRYWLGMKGSKRRDRLPVGEVLREARLGAGLSQEALAFSADVDRTYISNLENDHKSPTVETLWRLCKVLGLATSELIRRAEYRRPAK